MMGYLSQNANRIWELRCPDHGVRHSSSVMPGVEPRYCDYVYAPGHLWDDACGIELEKWCVPDAAQRQVDPEMPCGYCVGADGLDEDGQPIEDLMLSEPHPECLASVEAYMEDVAAERALAKAGPTQTKGDTVEASSMTVELNVDAKAMYEAAAAFHEAQRAYHAQEAKVHADAADRLRRIAAVHYRRVEEQPPSDAPVGAAPYLTCLAVGPLESGGGGQCQLRREHHGPHRYARS